jgi:hypothetical protein
VPNNEADGRAVQGGVPGRHGGLRLGGPWEKPLRRGKSHRGDQPSRRPPLLPGRSRPPSPAPKMMRAARRQVDVTTEETDPLTNAPIQLVDRGTRVAIGGSSYDWYNTGAGGVAYVGVFGVRAGPGCGPRAPGQVLQSAWAGMGRGLPGLIVGLAQGECPLAGRLWPAPAVIEPFLPFPPPLRRSGPTTCRRSCSQRSWAGQSTWPRPSPMR